MIRARLLLCSESVLQDELTNLLSLVNLIEEVSAPRFPVVLPRFAILVLLERDPTDPAEYPCHLRLNLADDLTAQAPIQVKFGAALVHRVVVRSHGVGIPHEGLLTLSFVTGDQVLVSSQIKVTRVPDA